MALSPRERKAWLMMAGYSIASFAKHIQVSPALVSMVVNDHHRNEKVETALAVAIRKPLEEVFPPRTGASEKLAGAGAL